MIPPRFSAALVLSLATASCAEGSADFHAKFEPDFTPTKATVSVFGAFHEGRMSPEAWDKVGPPLSRMLGEKACEVGYGDRLSADRPELFAAVDTSVRDEGITEELLEKLAPAAEGELLLVVTLSGQTFRTRDIDERALRNGTIGGRASGNQLRNAPPRSGTGRGAEVHEIGISGTLFSVARHRSVARLSMVYTGTNLDDALGKFVIEMARLVPSSSCKGWRWGGAEAH
ncbi:MAG: hypothetical protein ABJE95_21720 [Byssovorax sp.]